MTAAQPQTRTDSRAITSLVLAILGFIVVPVIASALAIWLGVTARRRIAEDPALTGDGLALTGIILGAAELVLFFLSLILLISSR